MLQINVQMRGNNGFLRPWATVQTLPWPQKMAAEQKSARMRRAGKLSVFQTLLQLFELLKALFLTLSFWFVYHVGLFCQVF